MSVSQSARIPRTLLVLVTPRHRAAGRLRQARAPAVAKPPVEVTVVTVAPRDVPAVFEYVAQTQSSRQVNIQARVDGFLDKRVYTEGSIVKDGQVLFLMDKKPFQAQVDAAKARVSKAQAALRRGQGEPRAGEAARAGEGAVAEGPRRRDRQLRERRRRGRGGQGPARRPRELNLSYSTITSPVAGISGAAAQADGTYLNQTNSQLTTVAVLSPMWVNFSLSENELQSLRDQAEKGRLRRAPDAATWSRSCSWTARCFRHRAGSRSPTRRTTRRPAPS